MTPVAGLPWPWAGTVQKLESGLEFSSFYNSVPSRTVEVMRGQVNDFANSVNRKTAADAKKGEGFGDGRES